MTTATTTAPAAPAPVTSPPAASWAAVSALARFETRRLLTRVPVLVALAVYVAWTVWRTRVSFDGFPELQDADRATQGGPLLVGLAVLLSANQAVLRSRRHDTDRHLSVLVVPRWGARSRTCCPSGRRPSWWRCAWAGSSHGRR